MRVFILANSQGTAAGVELAKTYPMLVRDELAPEHEVHVLAFSGWSIADFNRHLDNVVGLEPGLVVVQVGIVECSRRILSTREKHVLSFVPGSRHLTRFLHDRRRRVVLARHRLGLDTRLFTPAQFEAELKALVKRVNAAGADVLLLEIPPFGTAYERRHFPLINEDIELFNQVIRGFDSVDLLKSDDPLEDLWVEGTVHLNAEGHRLFAARLREIVYARMRQGVA